MYILFVHSRGDGHSLATVNNAMISIDVQVPVLVPVYNSLGYIPRTGIAGIYSNSIFNFLRKCPTVFCSSCITI